MGQGSKRKLTERQRREKQITIMSDVFDQWCRVREAEDLDTDNQVAAMLLVFYDRHKKSVENQTTLCFHCQMPVMYYICKNCGDRWTPTSPENNKQGQTSTAQESSQSQADTTVKRQAGRPRKTKRYIPKRGSSTHRGGVPTSGTDDTRLMPCSVRIEQLDVVAVSEKQSAGKHVTTRSQTKQECSGSMFTESGRVSRRGNGRSGNQEKKIKASDTIENDAVERRENGIFDSASNYNGDRLLLKDTSHPLSLSPAEAGESDNECDVGFGDNYDDDAHEKPSNDASVPSGDTDYDKDKPQNSSDVASETTVAMETSSDAAASETPLGFTKKSNVTKKGSVAPVRRSTRASCKITDMSSSGLGEPLPKISKVDSLASSSQKVKNCEDGMVDDTENAADGQADDIAEDEQTSGSAEKPCQKRVHGYYTQFIHQEYNPRRNKHGRRNRGGRKKAGSRKEPQYMGESDSEYEQDSEDDKNFPGDTARKSVFYTCKKCWMVCDTQHRLRDHMRVHTHVLGDRRRPVVCARCGHKCASKHMFYVHIKLHPDVLPFECPECGMTCETAKWLEEHRATHDNPCICQVCNKTLGNPILLKRHMEQGHEPQTFICDQCGDIFQKKCSLKNHMLKHHFDITSTETESVCICEVCGQVCINKGELNKHLQSVHSSGLPTFSCPTCGAVLKGKQGLKHHMLLHQDREKNVTCKLCHKAFFTQSQLKHHMRHHSSERPFTCDVCPKKFKSKGNLRAHMLLHGEKKHACRYCHMVFAVVADLRNHTRCHTGEKPYLCPICQTRFARADYLKKHKATHTGNTPYTCSQCGVNFSHTKSLQRHMQMHAEGGLEAHAEEGLKTHTDEIKEDTPGSELKSDASPGTKVPGDVTDFSSEGLVQSNATDHSFDKVMPGDLTESSSEGPVQSNATEHGSDKAVPDVTTKSSFDISLPPDNTDFSTDMTVPSVLTNYNSDSTSADISQEPLQAFSQELEAVRTVQSLLEVSASFPSNMTSREPCISAVTHPATQEPFVSSPSRSSTAFTGPVAFQAGPSPTECARAHEPVTMQDSLLASDSEVKLEVEVLDQLTEETFNPSTPRTAFGPC